MPKAIATSILVAAPLISVVAVSADRGNNLEEVVVTAQKRQESLQDAPIAISVLNAEQLTNRKIASLQDLGDGTIPSLRIQAFSNTPTSLMMAIRGNGPQDPGQITREGSVAIYIDGIYLGRAQGLGFQYADIERMEVLRGPQGTLFGRNALSGAVNIISKQPSGEFHFQQTLGAGNYGSFDSITHLDLPAFAGFKAKFDFAHTQREGWVENSAPGQADYDAYKKDGGRLALNYSTDALSVDYAFDRSRLSATQQYFQAYIDNRGLIGEERDRKSHTRSPVVPLFPTVTYIQGHALTVSWSPDDALAIKSLTGYRKLAENTNSNYGEAIYFNGLVVDDHINQDQFSQEFQAIGTFDRIEYVAGAFYYHENARERFQNLYSLDTFGIESGIPNSPIIPATTYDLFAGEFTPLRDTQADTKSWAIYSQATWTPPVLEDRLRITVGARYTIDEKTGTRNEYKRDAFRLVSNHTDPAVILDYRFNDEVSTYAKYSTGYKSGGSNSRSTDFIIYKPESVKAWELGFKSEFLDRRARLNAALFKSINRDEQIDFSDPFNASRSNTINAANNVVVKGVEIDGQLLITEGLTFSASYTGLLAHMPDQPNTAAGGVLEPFLVTQSPRHAGSAALDYQFKPRTFGSLSAHIDMTSTSPYAYSAKGFQRFDGYTLWNARITLGDIKLRDSSGKIKFAAWGKNLTNEQYVVYAYPIGEPLLVVDQAFGDPRTFGVEFTYEL